MKIRIGIMGLGRIGRNVFRMLYPRDDIEVMAAVDIADPVALVYLLNFDTIHRRFYATIGIDGNIMDVRGKKIPILPLKAPGDVDWKALGVDIVIEATGKYKTRELLQKHLQMGAKRVILTSPPQGEVDAQLVLGVNDHLLNADSRIVSASSIAANAMAPICKILNDSFGIKHGFMTAVHAYTDDQRLADVAHAEIRKSRAAAENIIPAELWSPRIVETILPELSGKLDGMAYCVPVPDGTAVDMVTMMSRPVTKEGINEAVRAASEKHMKNIVEYTDQPIVSSDVIGNSHSALFDSLSTQVLNGDMLKTITWFDNGWGYAARIVDLICRLSELK
ncbi:MAG: type I glyceraldehyde-3-phosphate dehydrogenase [Acidobacteriota bacterium]